MLKYFITFLSILLLVACTDSTTQTNDIADASPETQLEQTIANMKNWTSYQSEIESSSIEHPELDAYSSNTELSYVKEPFQLSKRYEDNYFGGHFESFYSEETGFSVKNEYGNQTWTAVNETITDNELIHAISDLLQLLLQEQDALSFTDSSAQLTIQNGDFEAIKQAIDLVNELRSKLATPQDILVNLFDEDYVSTHTFKQIDATLSFQNRELTNYMITVDRSIEGDEYGPGLLELTEAFSAVNSLQEIPAPTK